MTIHIGIDPGATGAIAVFEVELGVLTIYDMPVMEVLRGGKAKKEINPYILAEILGMWKSRSNITVTMEKVGAMPGQGVSSMFQFGRGVGMLEGVLAGIGNTVNYVTPQKWQKEVAMRPGKDGGRERAMQLFPGNASDFFRKKDDGRADAALIAYWSFIKS